MKNKKERKTREGKKKRYLVLAVAALAIIIPISGFLVDSVSRKQVSSVSQLKAAIVDHLSLSTPNQTFIQKATDLLQQAGYTADYYPSEEVTVEFYRDLPTHGYKLVILRVHSSATNPDGTEGPVTLFTSERYDKKKYVYEQLTDQLVIVSHAHNSSGEVKEGVAFFGINPPFITQSMRGEFRNSVVILMGCEGYDNPSMAEAFVEKGAKVYISWSDLVLAPYTDSAITHLLRHFLVGKLTLKEALRETFKEVGSDPVFRSLLIYYPLKVGNQTIDNIIHEN
jgi:hypothetical protein